MSARIGGEEGLNVAHPEIIKSGKWNGFRVGLGVLAVAGTITAAVSAAGFFGVAAVAGYATKELFFMVAIGASSTALVSNLALLILKIKDGRNKSVKQPAPQEKQKVNLEQNRVPEMPLLKEEDKAGVKVRVWETVAEADRPADRLNSGAVLQITYPGFGYEPATKEQLEIHSQSQSIAEVLAAEKLGVKTSLVDSQAQDPAVRQQALRQALFDNGFKDL